MEWNIGEAAGHLAARSVATGRRPREVAIDGARVADLQRELVARGVELAWPADLDLEEGDPHVHAR